MKRSEITFHKVNKSRLAELVSISRSTFRSSYGDKNTPENMQSYLDNSFNAERLGRELANRNCEFYFAQIRGEIIGYLKINLNDAQTYLKEKDGMELERIYVLKEHQGKGVGAILMDFLKEKVIEKGRNYIWLGVWEKNVEAISFYKRHGFMVVDTHPFMLGEEEQVDFVMRVEAINN